MGLFMMRIEIMCGGLRPSHIRPVVVRLLVGITLLGCLSGIYGSVKVLLVTSQARVTFLPTG